MVIMGGVKLEAVVGIGSLSSGEEGERKKVKKMCENGE